MSKLVGNIVSAALAVVLAATLVFTIGVRGDLSSTNEDLASSRSQTDSLGNKLAIAEGDIEDLIDEVKDGEYRLDQAERAAREAYVAGDSCYRLVTLFAGTGRATRSDINRCLDYFYDSSPPRFV